MQKKLIGLHYYGERGKIRRYEVGTQIADTLPAIS